MDTCKCEHMTDSEKMEALQEFIDQYQEQEHGLIQIMHVAQNIFGYLPIDVQQFIAERMN